MYKYQILQNPEWFSDKTDFKLRKLLLNQHVRLKAPFGRNL